MWAYIYTPAPWIRHGIDLPTWKIWCFSWLPHWKNEWMAWIYHIDPPVVNHIETWMLKMVTGGWCQWHCFTHILKKMIIKSWRKILKLRDVKWKVVKFFQPGILMVLMWVAHAACPRAGCRFPPIFSMQKTALFSPVGGSTEAIPHPHGHGTSSKMVNIAGNINNTLWLWLTVGHGKYMAHRNRWFTYEEWWIFPWLC